ncbi:uncharacterized protein LOC144438482 [Glandiceps talaboti]
MADKNMQVGHQETDNITQCLVCKSALQVRDSHGGYFCSDLCRSSYSTLKSCSEQIGVEADLFKMKVANRKDIKIEVPFHFHEAGTENGCSQPLEGEIVKLSDEGLLQKQTAVDRDGMVLDVEHLRHLVSDHDLKLEREAMIKQRDQCSKALYDIDKKVKCMLHVIDETLSLYTENSRKQSENVTQVQELCCELQEMTYTRNEDVDMLKQKMKLLEEKFNLQCRKQDEMEKSVKSLAVKSHKQEKMLAHTLLKEKEPSIKQSEMTAVQNKVKNLELELDILKREMSRPWFTNTSSQQPVHISIQNPINNYVPFATSDPRVPATSVLQDEGQYFDPSRRYVPSRNVWGYANHTAPPHYQHQPAELPPYSDVTQSDTIGPRNFEKHTTEYDREKKTANGEGKK